MSGLCAERALGGRGEADVPTEPSPARQDARVPWAHVDERRPEGAEAPARQRATPADRLNRGCPAQGPRDCHGRSGSGPERSSIDCSAAGHGWKAPRSCCSGDGNPGHERLGLPWGAASAAVWWETAPGGACGKLTDGSAGSRQRMEFGSVSLPARPP